MIWALPLTASLITATSHRSVGIAGSGIPDLVRGLLDSEMVQVAVDRVAVDFATTADFEGVDLTGGDELEHEGTADAQDVGCFLD